MTRPAHRRVLPAVVGVGLLALGVALTGALSLESTLPPSALGAEAPEQLEPKRINKAIELLEMGEPVYYVQVSSGGYEAGLRLAQTYADAVGYNLEQASYSMMEFRAFIQGLIDGGPTPSGHRTPAVIATLPLAGREASTVLANSWMVEQALSAGAHGIWLIHARSEEAVREFVASARYPFSPPLEGIREGLRSSGGEGMAAQAWGISSSDYLRVADLWPDNPEGEILLGIKTEDRHSVEVADALISVPGISMVEWGPNSMAMSFNLPLEAPEVQEARRRVAEAARRHDRVIIDVFTNTDNVVSRIRDEGILWHFANEAAARVGREFTGRTMPW